MKRIFALFLGLSLLLPLLACSSGVELADVKLGGIHSQTGDIYPDEFLTFDKTKVSFDEFRYFYLNYKNMYLEENAQYFANGQNEAALKEEILQCLLDRWAVIFLAKEHGVSLSSEEKEAVLAEIETNQANYASKDAFLEELHASYLSLTFYQDMLEYSALYLKLFEALYGQEGKYAFSQEECYQYFRDHYVAVQQIYLPFEEGENAENHPKTLEAANSIHAQTATEDFWVLLEKYGKDDNMLAYPDGYYITDGQAEEVLLQASNSLEMGGVSLPVVGKSGIYIIKRLELKELRMEENRQTALYGYQDSEGVWFNGAYDSLFYELYRDKAEKIKITYPEIWEQISTSSVY